MPVNITQPANRITLTNISLVRLKKGKKRFEIACYKNKLLEYRSGQETDLDNVLQVPTIFLNVSKGQTAPSSDLAKAFGKDVSRDDMIIEILKKGEVQVGAGERKELLDRIEKEVVELVSQRVVDPETKRVYTTGMIKKALDLLSKQAGHSQQGLDTSRQLDKDDEDDGGGRAAEEETAGYMGLGKIDINDDDARDHNTKHKNKKSSKSSKHNKAKKPAPQDTPPHSEDDQPTSQAPASTTTTANDHPNPSSIPTWTGISTSKAPKVLALEAMKALIYHQPIPIQRARMRLRITIPSSFLKNTVKATPSDTAADEKPVHSTMTVKERILTYIEQVENQGISDAAGDWEVTGFVEPGAYKGLGEFVGGETRGRGRVEVLDMAVTHED